MEDDSPMMGTLLQARTKLKTGVEELVGVLTCPVCLDSAVPGEATMCLPCNHHLCGKCVTRLFTNGKPRCPHCQHPFTKRNIEDDSYLRDIAELLHKCLPELGFKLDEVDDRRVVDFLMPAPPTASDEHGASAAKNSARGKVPASKPLSPSRSEGSEQGGHDARPPKRRRPLTVLEGELNHMTTTETMEILEECDAVFGRSEVSEDRAGSSAPPPSGTTSSRTERRQPSPSSTRGKNSRDASPPQSLSKGPGKKRALPKPSAPPSAASSSSPPPPPPPPPLAPGSSAVRRELSSRPHQAPVAAPAPAPAHRKWKVRDFVEVKPRTGTGVNKPGGAGRIVAANPDDTFDIKYILTGRIEKGISPGILSEPLTLMTDRTDRAARRRTSSPPRTYSDVASSPQPARRSLTPRLGRSSGRDGSTGPASSTTAPAPPPPPPPPRRARDLTPPATKEKVGASSRPTASAVEQRPQPARPATAAVTAAAAAPPPSALQHEHDGDPDSFVDRPREIVLVATSLSDRSLEQVRAFAKRFGAKVERAMGPTVTHVICKADKQKRAEQRTLKYLHGLLNRRWLLSSKWIADSLKDGHVKAELGYELKGDVKANRLGAPLRARTSRVEDKPALFQGVTFGFYGEFPPPKPTRRDLERLIEAGQGKVLSGTSPLDHTAQHHNTFILCNSLPADHDSFRAAPAQDVQNQDDCIPPLITSDWLLDSISNYHLQCVQSYHP